MTVAPSANLARPDDPPPPGSVLVVESDGGVSAAVDLLLRHYGYAVRTAATLADARRAFAASSPDVVVLDLPLPDGTGLDLLEHLRSTGRTARVVVLTADADPDRLRQLKRLRPDRFLRKPLNFLDLLAAVRGSGAEVPPPGLPGPFCHGRFGASADQPI